MTGAAGGAIAVMGYIDREVGLGTMEEGMKATITYECNNDAHTRGIYVALNTWADQ